MTSWNDNNVVVTKKNYNTVPHSVYQFGKRFSIRLTSFVVGEMTETISLLSHRVLTYLDLDTTEDPLSQARGTQGQLILRMMKAIRSDVQKNGVFHSVRKLKFSATTRGALKLNSTHKETLRRFRLAYLFPNLVNVKWPVFFEWCEGLRIDSVALTPRCVGSFGSTPNGRAVLSSLTSSVSLFDSPNGYDDTKEFPTEGFLEFFLPRIRRLVLIAGCRRERDRARFHFIPRVLHALFEEIRRSNRSDPHSVMLETLIRRGPEEKSRGDIIPSRMNIFLTEAFGRRGFSGESALPSAAISSLRRLSFQGAAIPFRIKERYASPLMRVGVSVESVELQSFARRHFSQLTVFDAKTICLRLTAFSDEKSRRITELFQVCQTINKVSAFFMLSLTPLDYSEDLFKNTFLTFRSNHFGEVIVIEIESRERFKRISMNIETIEAYVSQTSHLLKAILQQLCEICGSGIRRLRAKIRSSLWFEGERVRNRVRINQDTAMMDELLMEGTKQSLEYVVGMCKEIETALDDGGLKGIERVEDDIVQGETYRTYDDLNFPIEGCVVWEKSRQ